MIKLLDNTCLPILCWFDQFLGVELKGIRWVLDMIPWLLSKMRYFACQVKMSQGIVIYGSVFDITQMASSSSTC